jgi:hypothetical protein
MFTRDYFLQLFPLGLPLKSYVPYQPHTVQQLQAEIEADTEEITGDMLCLTQLSTSESTRSKDLILNMCSHAHRLSMKVNFNSCTTCLCTLENYENTVHQNF